MSKPLKPAINTEPSLPIKVWLELLPFEISQQALNNLWAQATGSRLDVPNTLVNNMGDAINLGIIWCDTPERENYWERIWSEYRTFVYADFVPGEEIEIEFTL